MVFPHVEGHLVFFWGNFEFWFLNRFLYPLLNPFFTILTRTFWNGLTIPKVWVKHYSPTIRHHPAGAAYLPLEPTHPGARLRFLLEDSQAQCLVTCWCARRRNLMPEEPRVVSEVGNGNKNWSSLYDIYLQYSYWFSW